MASPGVIDGAATPQDMYSPSKNAHCCGPSTECIVCMRARALAHTHTRAGLLHVHTENTIHESTQQRTDYYFIFIFFKEAELGGRGVGVFFFAVHMKPTAGVVRSHVALKE